MSVVGIIPDGNRRWASENNADLVSVYNKSIEKVLSFAEECPSLRIRHMCFYGLSKNNMSKRPLSITKEIIHSFCTMLESFISKQSADLFQFRIIGDSSVNKLLSTLDIATKHRHGAAHTISFLVNYDIEWDLKYYPIIQSIEVPDVDLVIRTGGDKRLSGFLPIQSQYSEIVFSDRNFPQYTHENLYKDIFSFRQIERRFGA